MNKKIKEYREKYGKVPNDFIERFQYILQELKPDNKDWEKVKKGIKSLQNAKWDNINFIFYFIPQATPRARFSNRTRVFYVKNAFDYNTLFKQFIENTNDLYKMITTPCRFYCDLYFEMPAQMNKVEKILSELRLIGASSKPD